jgi:DNA modification methylase
MTTKTPPVTLVQDDHNANRGTVRGRGMLERSLQQYGAGRAPVADRNGKLIGGNKTAEVAMELGLDVQLIPSDGKTLYVIQRTDLDLDDDPDHRARELAIADNRVGEVSLEWEPEILSALQDDGVDLDGLWFDEELAEVFAAGDDAPVIGLTDPDDVPEPPADPITKPGDVWLLGEHRICCGDSTVATDVERLLSGAKPTLMVTDPPYGVEYDANWRNEAADKGLIQHGASRVGLVQNDERIDWSEAFALVPAEVVYCWHAGRHASTVQASLEVCGYEIRSQIIWAKSRFAISRGHYHWQHEPCWYAVRKGATASWIGDRSQTTLWEMNLDRNVGGGHSTQKPVECMARPIRNHSGDVYDPFLGSGTTVIAAEMHGRTCYGMEISPAYCDVIVRRWEDFTGNTATREMVE